MTRCAVRSACSRSHWCAVAGFEGGVSPSYGARSGGSCDQLARCRGEQLETLGRRWSGTEFLPQKSRTAEINGCVKDLQRGREGGREGGETFTYLAACAAAFFLSL